MSDVTPTHVRTLPDGSLRYGCPGHPEAGGWRVLDKYDADLLRCSDGVLIWDVDPACAPDEAYEGHADPTL